MASEEQLSYVRKGSLGPVSEGGTWGKGVDVFYVPLGHRTRKNFQEYLKSY